MPPITTCQSCCPSCGLHFAGDRAFDLHVTAEGHIDPREAHRRDGRPVLAVKTAEGSCKMIVGGALHPIAIWQEADAEDVSERMAERRAWRTALAQERAGADSGVETR